MDKELFTTWFKKIFLKHCGEERPVILIVDNHDSHFSYEVLETAKENQASISLFLCNQITHL